MSYMSILHWFLDIVAFVVTVASYFKMRSAKAAENAVRQKLLKRLAWEHFAEMARQSGTLTRNVRAADWPSATAIAESLAGSLAQAEGSWRNLLTDTERDKLKTASRETQMLLRAMPLGGSAIEPKAHEEMSERCDFLLQALGAIEGRLKYVEEWEGA